MKRQIEMDLSKKTSESNQYALANIPAISQDCVGDINGSVKFEDLLTLLSSWHSENPAADLDGNGTLEWNNLLVLISGDGGRSKFKNYFSPNSLENREPFFALHFHHEPLWEKNF